MSNLLKKASAACIVLAMTLSLAACGGAPAAPASSSEAASSEAASSEAASSEASAPADGGTLTVEQYDERVETVMGSIMAEAMNMTATLMSAESSSADETAMKSAVVTAVDAMGTAFSDLAALNAPAEYADVTPLFKAADEKMAAALAVFHEAADAGDEAKMTEAQTALNDAMAAFQTGAEKYSALYLEMHPEEAAALTPSEAPVEAPVEAAELTPASSASAQ